MNADRKKYDVSNDSFKTLSYFIVKLPEKVNKGIWDQSESQKEEEHINIEICPVRIQPKFENGKKKDKETLYPFWIPATIDREGVISSSQKTPTFVRDYLSPNPTDFPILASSKLVDTEKSKIEFKVESWKEYWDKCELLFKAVTGKAFEDFNNGLGIELVVELERTKDLARSILKLYDNSLEKEKFSTLLQRIVDGTKTKREQPTPEEIFESSGHRAHMNGAFPLSKSQRSAIYAFSSLKDGDVLAVNGPPGTGKTTWLQTVLANLLIDNALKQIPPPLVMASSANNQAITNILDGFKLGGNSLLEQRWIREVTSLGLYFKSKQEGSYQMFTDKMGTGFIQQLESGDVSEMETQFLEKCRQQFSDVADLEDAMAQLHQRLSKNIDKQNEFLTAAIEFEKIDDRLNVLGVESREELDSLRSNELNEISDLKKQKEALFRAENSLKQANKEIPFFDKLLSFLPKKKERRETRFYRAVKVKISPPGWSDFEGVLDHIQSAITFNRNQIESKESEQKKLQKEASWIKSKQQRYFNVIEEWKSKHTVKLEYLHKETGKEYKHLKPSEDMNVCLDISLRYEAFWLAIHYFEAKYLHLLKNKEKGKERGEKSYKQKLQRIACITPIFISTFHSLPNYANYFGNNKEQSYFELFDYLIVDEAGQVTPDNAVASFSLAKKAIVVGDVQQIEPVWNISEQMDRVVLADYGLTKKDYSEEKIESVGLKGFFCSSGSLMKMAQNACNFRLDGYDGGVLLKEHRRCVDPIISYSDTYVYNKQLIFTVGKEAKISTGLPPKGFMHIPGESEKKGKSRINSSEAKVISRWINENAKRLCDVYEKPIEKIIAVVSPYKTQSILIMKQLLLYSKNYKKITVGTVHALQGAECPIVIFSTVLSHNDDKTFINNKYNMLNVAVTRAKHHFLVFGHGGILNAKENSPLGNLKKWLIEEDNAELSNNIVYANEDIFSKEIARLTELKHHVEALSKAIRIAEKYVIIVSPFISNYAIESDGLVEKIRKKVDSGVKVTIVTDSHLDMKNGRIKPSSEKGRKLLKSGGAELKLVDGIHSKTLIVDDKLLIEGSFNWLSAVRDENNPFFRMESSIVLKGELASEKISGAIKELAI